MQAPSHTDMMIVVTSGESQETFSTADTIIVDSGIALPSGITIQTLEKQVLESAATSHISSPSSPPFTSHTAMSSTTVHTSTAKQAFDALASSMPASRSFLAAPILETVASSVSGSISNSQSITEVDVNNEHPFQSTPSDLDLEISTSSTTIQVTDEGQQPNTGFNLETHSSSPTVQVAAAQDQESIITTFDLETPATSQPVSVPTQEAQETTEKLPTPSTPVTVFEPLTCFTLFQELPSEVRVRIWKQIDDPADPRGIQVSIQQEATTGSDKSILIKKIPTFKSLTPVPVILHVCQESRKEGLKVYKTVFKAMDKNGVERGEIYYNPERDFLCVHVPKWTLRWKIYTGGHPHPIQSGVVSPFGSAKINIIRCQATRDKDNPTAEIIVGVGPTMISLPLEPDAQFTRFDALMSLLGEKWDLVEFYVWKREWWYEHWDYLFNELTKIDEPVSENRKHKKGPKLPGAPVGRKNNGRKMHVKRAL